MVCILLPYTDFWWLFPKSVGTAEKTKKNMEMEHDPYARFGAHGRPQQQKFKFLIGLGSSRGGQNLSLYRLFSVVAFSFSLFFFCKALLINVFVCLFMSSNVHKLHLHYPYSLTKIIFYANAAPGCYSTLLVHK